MNVELQIRRSPTKAKKADVAKHRKMFSHVGLLFNGPPGRGRVVLHLVIRPLLYLNVRPEPGKCKDSTSRSRNSIHAGLFQLLWSQEKEPAELAQTRKTTHWPSEGRASSMPNVLTPLFSIRPHRIERRMPYPFVAIRGNLAERPNAHDHQRAFV